MLMQRFTKKKSVECVAFCTVLSKYVVNTQLTGFSAGFLDFFLFKKMIKVFGR